MTYLGTPPEMPYDPVQERFPLPLRSVFHPLGFPLELTTNSPEVIEAGLESWSQYRPGFERPPIRLRILVELAEGPPPAEPVFRLQRGLAAIVSDQRNFATCDLPSRFGWCLISSQAVADRAWFRWYFLEAMTYMLLAQEDVTPVHAACVALGGRGALLCGPSGAGKSTLAFACARAGWTYVGDDATLLLQGSANREVLGKAHQFRFRPEAVSLFPELERSGACIQPNGKPTLEVPATAFPEIGTDSRSRLECVAFLKRHHDGPPACFPLSPEEALGRLLRELPNYGEDVYNRHVQSVQQLAAVPAYELCYQHCEQAVSLLVHCLRP